jgi:hypothetical protein
MNPSRFVTPHQELRMRIRFPAVAAVLMVMFLAGWCATASAQATSAPAQSAPAGGTIVLDTTSTWRMFHVLKAPLMQVATGPASAGSAVASDSTGRADGALKTVPHYDDRGKLDWTESHRKAYRDILAPETAAAPADWKDPNFDDSDWGRGTAARAMRSPYLERLCLRGKFMVTDPAKVKGLALSVDYHGGAVVYVNGQEIGRQNLAAGATMAEEYPLDAFVGPDGKLIGVRGDEALQRAKTPADVLKRIEGRIRKLTVAIPPAALRAGLNVVAVELVRAPYNKVVDEQMAVLDNHGKAPIEDLSWNTCEIKRAQLTAAGAEGLAPCASRGAGFELWNSEPLAIDYDMDQGEAGPLQPIRLVGARGGAYSGKVVLGSDKPIRGLTAVAGDLKSDSGAIPADDVQVRYAMPWGNFIITNPACNEAFPYPAVPTPLAALYETAPKEVPVYRGAVNDRCMKPAGAPAPVFGAVVPIWVTVHVPKDAKPGAYSGVVTVSADGLKPTAIAVTVKVLEWTLPDPQDRKTWVELIQSPDTLTLEYAAPLWTAKHWDLVARSMDYIGALGSRVLFTPLIAQTNAGNDESMVRWVKKPDGTYEYDFSILDKYLDLAEKRMGKPKVLVLNVWDWYLGGTGTRLYMNKELSDGKGPLKTHPPLVTVVDKATGKAQNVAMIDYLDPNAKAQWKPLFDQLRERLAKRGLEKAMMLGMVTDNWAFKEQVEFLKDVSGNLPWVNAGHYTREALPTGLANWGYQSSFFGYQFDYLKTRYGWNLPRLETLFERVGLDFFPPTRWRGLGEQAIFGNMRGVGRLGADTWYVAKDNKGNRIARAWERFPGANWGYLNCDSSTLAPAPEGAVATVRYEALREGLQECEARVAIEQALTDAATQAKVADLAKKYEPLMVERQLAFWRSIARLQVGPNAELDDPHAWRGPALNGHLWYVQSLWQERGEKLYNLAAEIARKVEGK